MRTVIKYRKLFQSLLLTAIIVAFSAQLGFSQCTHYIDLNDTFGDGWNGGTVTVSVNGTPVLTNITLASGSGPSTYSFTASTGNVINVTMTNAGSYPSEMRIWVYSGAGTILATQQPVAAPGTNGTGACAAPSYCAAGATTCDEYISRVQVGSIDNSTACTAGGYANYTGMSTTMSIGTGYGITVTNGYPYSSDQCGVWVDWNQDYDFLDANETITITGTPGTGPYTATITPPAGATLGNTRMRVRICYTTGLSSCGTASYGEVEDYTVNVTSSGCTTPGAPTSVVGTPTGQTTANLNWAAGSPVGSATVTYYWVVGTIPTVTYGSGVAQGTTTGTSASTSALSCGTTYYLRVYAYTSCNGTSSAYTTSASFTTSACTTPCSSVIPIGGCGSGFSQTYNGGGAGSWSTSYCGYATPGIEQIYSFVAPTTGTYSIQITAASGYVDYGWQANTCASTGWTCIGDYSSTGNFGSMSWTAGTTYYILLDDENSTAGTHTFYINCPAATPCSSVIPIGGCGSGFSQTYNGGGAGSWSTSYCGFATPGIEQIYSFVAPTTGTYSLQVTAASGFVDYGWQAATCASTGWTCIDDVTSAGTYGSMSWNAGTTYYILLDDENSTAGTHTFYINCPSAGPCGSITTIAGCGAANTQTYNVTGAGAWDITACGYNTPGMEQVYQFTPTTTGNHSIVVTSATGGYVDYFWKASSGGCNNTGWTCIDDISFTGVFGTMSWTAGTTYYLLLDPEGSGAYNHQFYIDCPGASGPCISPTLWMSAAAPTDNVPVQVAACNYAGEYDEITSVVAGRTYQFSSSISTDWLTLTTTANTLITEGTTPITWVATFSGTVRIHIHANSSCDTESSCRSMTVTCTSCFGGGGLAYYIHPTTGLQSTYLGECMENIDCGTTHSYYDNGGPSANYSTAINNIYRTFCPDAIGKCVRASMVSMDIENAPASCYDYLVVGNGPTQNVTTLWRGCRTLASPLTQLGAWNGGTWTSTDASGCLTFRFYSDAITTRPGWNITLSCVDCAEANYQVTSECEGSIGCCGNTSFSGASTGPGLSSTCNGCVVSENYTTWYYFEITTDGTLGLNLVPNNLGTAVPCVDPDDYDFALFRADDCSNLGSPIRCSYAWNERCYNNTGPYTGMASTNPWTGGAVTDQSEIVNGDGFVTPLAVTAGQTYFLMVNGWSPSDLGYNLTFQLSGGAAFEDCSTLPPLLPVELVSMNAECNDGISTIKWSTASETNNDYFTVLKSYNGFMYKTIGWVMGQENSNKMHNYSFVDEEYSEGLVYYQLKQTDLDGNITYSKPVSVNCQNGMDVEPFIITNDIGNQDIIIYFNILDDRNYEILFTDNLGRKIIEKDYSVAKYGNTLRIPKSELGAGVYYMSVHSDNVLITKPVVIAR
ncbi:MAG: GEVED domain-containing protein [Bacteroidota bacterium]